ncbi:hypothetical protein Godav_006994 [Gossypium davidsonii]|uniref:RNase H type-1 domain-containing protein n=2 Tax=Gossypium TaxID=3633 RepID=A0A7J8S5H8_GOSDV|nr:hypothetical protein [Gossypium davidsonii]
MVTRVSDIFQFEARMIVEGSKLIWSKGFNQFRHILKGSNKVVDYLAKVAVGHYSHRSTTVFKKTTRGGCS